jgi:SAM-dependent methyltransferase
MPRLYPITDHNRFYATEECRTEPKEYFKFLASLADPLLTPGARVLDVGCAAGEFLRYLRSVYPGLCMTGIDLDEEFLDKATKSVPDARFVRGNIQTKEGLPDTRFDVVFMAGVNLYFADAAPWLRNIVALTEGTAYVFGVFNPEDLDVRAMVSRPGSTEVQPWNLISQKSISSHLEDIPHRFIPWNLPVPNPRVHEDPLRSWTIPSDGGYLVVNGMQLIHRFAALEISRVFST